MAPRLSYDPSAQSVLGHLVGPGGVIAGQGPSLRRRVTCPVVLRSSGLGEIYGGELVIAAETHTDRLLRSLESLRETDVAGILIATRELPRQVDQLLNPPLPIGFSLTSQTLQQLQSTAEQYLIRRRRELYGFSQILQHSVIDASIAGDDVHSLLHAAINNSVSSAVFDSEGEVLTAGPQPPRSDLVACRIAAHGVVSGTLLVQAANPYVVAPVLASNERRGLIIVPASGPIDQDEAELVAETLAQACAITLVRTRAETIPNLSQVLPGLPRVRDGRWRVVAVTASDVSLSRIARAVKAELAPSLATVPIGRENDALCVVVPGDSSLTWHTLADKLSTRLGAKDLQLGVGRSLIGPRGAESSARQALQAIQRQPGATCTLFEEIEVDSLLDAVDDWEPYVTARIGPLLQDNAGRSELLKTLAAYLDSGRSVAATARALSIHRNTVLYRLTSLQELLNAKLDNESEVFALALALRLYRLHGSEA